MARIEGVTLPYNKRIEYGLTYVFGIGLKSAQDILTKTKINFDKRVKDLTDEEVALIQKEITTKYTVEGDLRKELALNIRRLQDIGSYRGYDVYITQDGWTVKTEDKSLAAHVEDTIAITDQGPKILTRLIKEGGVGV